jgi:uridine phosphorylase
MFYKLKLSAIEKKNRTLFKNQFSIDNYVTEGSLTLFSQFAKMCIVGTTVTCPGFYAPQGRKLRYELQYPNLVDELPKFKTHKIPCITNFEMETSAIYFLGKLLGHNCLSLSLIVANRITKQFSNNYPKKMDELIKNTVEKLS